MKVIIRYLKKFSVFLLFASFSHASLASLMVANDFVSNGPTYNVPSNNWITFSHAFDTSLGDVVSAKIGLTYSGIIDTNVSVMATWVANNSTPSLTFDPVFLGTLFTGDNKYSVFNLPLPGLDTLNQFGGIAFSFIGDSTLPYTSTEKWVLHSSNLETTYSVVEPPMIAIFLWVSLWLAINQRKKKTHTV